MVDGAVTVVESEHLQMRWMPATGIWQVCAKSGQGAFIVYYDDDVKMRWQPIFPGNTIVKVAEINGKAGNTLEFDFGVGVTLSTEQCNQFLSILEDDSTFWRGEEVIVVVHDSLLA